MITANRDASTISPKVVRDAPTETSLTPLRRGFSFPAAPGAANVKRDVLYANVI
jgi:hypothetical protein